MIDPEQLRESFESIEIHIEVFLERITKPYKSRKRIGTIIHGLISFFRDRARLRMLLDADIDGFFEDLNREALTHITFLHGYHAKLAGAEEDISAVTIEPLLCAVVAGNTAAVKDIDRLMPTQMCEDDTKHGFAYATLVRKLAAGDTVALPKAFDDFKRLGIDMGRYEWHVKILQGLIEKNSKMFNEGLVGYLDSYSDLPPDEEEELSPGEDLLSIEGLAFIQLAKREGIKVTVKHRMIPPELQQVRTVIPTSGYPDWPG